MLVLHRTPAFVASLVTFVLACGGGAGANSEGAKDPTNAAGGGEAGNPATKETTSSPEDGAGGGTTTTTALPNNGELQGAKLGNATRTEVETKGESGPKSTGGKPSGEPGRTPADIKTIIQLRRDEARACYDKGLESHPGIEGDLTIKWTIDPQGNVTDAAVDTSRSQILEPSVGQCVVDVIKKIKFAASQKGYETRASYPFNFHPKNFPAGTQKPPPGK